MCLVVSLLGVRFGSELFRLEGGVVAREVPPPSKATEVAEPRPCNT